MNLNISIGASCVPCPYRVRLHRAFNPFRECILRLVVVLLGTLCEPNQSLFVAQSNLCCILLPALSQIPQWHFDPLLCCIPWVPSVVPCSSRASCPLLTRGAVWASARRSKAIWATRPSPPRSPWRRRRDEHGERHGAAPSRVRCRGSSAGWRGSGINQDVICYQESGSDGIL